MPRRFLLALILPAVLLVSGCWFGSEPEEVRLSGQTMGTTYSVIAIGVDLDQEALAAEVDATLAAVNAKMSNWDPASEVSTFSAARSTAPVRVSPEFAHVLAAANDVHEKTGGKFDVTLGPLIELWGFGPRKPEDPVPADAAITEALEGVGQARLLTLDQEAGTLKKSAPETGINLSAIAKGYGVDAVAKTLQGFGVENYMVEIGGDLVTKGQNAKGEAWRIGIEKPDAAAQTVQLIVPVSDLGLATSGDYRNYFEHEGQRYSHILDPVAGRPVTHRTASVTVIAENAMLADAWATAMLVLGSAEGLKLAEQHKLAVFFIDRDVQAGEDAYMTSASSAFEALTGN
ncbi:FAD:protein FMN transferase (plasmid) [Leisingera caerulea]|uniref:FAD:protein FMN transferase n=1 Tax=Leisingera caerulea TaxID=506591 RepID=A0ABY5X2Z7_LEICA|nr:FAD:protein FMN transferase [Leisingera caerulea]UWQ52035.1 FAD:protein FMN transferase [Leisingera caerulea]UWQ60768.1 FAD:protein FMN transferase [Leisingera caerulea]